MQQVFYIHEQVFSPAITEALQHYREQLRSYLMVRAERLLNNGKTMMPALPDMAQLERTCSDVHTFEYNVLLPCIQEVQFNLQAIRSWDVNFSLEDAPVSPSTIA